MLQSEIVIENGPHPIPALGRKSPVLVVDDNKTNREAVSRMLVSLGHKVTLAGNGFEGGILFLTRSYDLAIIDLDVPQMNIWELARILKEHSPNREGEELLIRGTAQGAESEARLAQHW